MCAASEAVRPGSGANAAGVVWSGRLIRPSGAPRDTDTRHASTASDCLLPTAKCLCVIISGVRILSQYSVVAIFSFALVWSVVSGGVQHLSAQSPAKSVWDGVYTEAQATRGRGFYAQHCAECHGGNLQGGEGKALRGDKFWEDWQEAPVGYLLGQISRNMPHSEDGSLKGTLGVSTYTDIVAHILSSNGFPAGTTELTQAASADIQIVRKEGTRELPSGSFAHVVGCLSRGADRAWRLQRGSRPARVLATEPVNVNVPLGDREYVLKFVLTSLDKYAGYRMSVRASLMGEGGVDGLNVQKIDPVNATCE